MNPTTAATAIAIIRAEILQLSAAAADQCARDRSGSAADGAAWEQRIDALTVNLATPSLDALGRVEKALRVAGILAEA